MVEQEQDHKINVWTSAGKQRALDMFFAGDIHSEDIYALSKMEQLMFRTALKADYRLYITVPVDVAASLYSNIQESAKSIYNTYDKNLPVFVPRDTTTKMFLGAAVGLHIFPEFPVTDFIAGALVVAAIRRGVRLKNKDNSESEHDQKLIEYKPDNDHDDRPEL